MSQLEERKAEIKDLENARIRSIPECDVAEQLRGISTRMAVTGMSTRNNDKDNATTLVTIEFSLGKKFSMYPQDFEGFEVVEVSYKGLNVEVLLKVISE